MKRIILYAVLAGCLYAGCKSGATKISQAGVYKLEKQMLSGGGKDSVYARAQVKIYTDRHFMYAGMAPDSSVGFGVGYYKLDTGNRIEEGNIYSSRALDSAQGFNLKITRADSGYTQVFPDIVTVRGVRYIITENYTKIPSTGTSKLDGVWKLDSSYLVKGKDTTKQPSVQYKAFWGGRFIFVHRYPLDNTNTKFKNGFGYGEFTLSNDTLSEKEEMTSHAALMGRQFAIKINFRGDDQYTQVINDSKNNQLSVEVYRRIK